MICREFSPATGPNNDHYKLIRLDRGAFDLSVPAVVQCLAREVVPMGALILGCSGVMSRVIWHDLVT